MPTADQKLPWEWTTSGTSELWGTRGTYSTVAYERLPVLRDIGSQYEWLGQLPQREYPAALDSDENQLGAFPVLEKELNALGFSFPTALRELITHPVIQAHIPSCTGCYLALSDHVTELPGFPGHFVIRFLNDSQCCVMWFLLFQPNAPTRVLSSRFFIEQDIFDEMQYEQSDGKPLAYQDVTAEARICSASFDEFIVRFCLENVIWFSLHDGRPLSPYEEAYLKAAN